MGFFFNRKASQRNSNSPSIEKVKSMSVSKSDKEVQRTATEHENVRLGKEFLDAMNKHDMERLTNLFHPDASVEMVEGTKMDGTTFLNSLQDIYYSFPDFAVTLPPAELQKDGSVIFRGIVGSGTHTGAPYGFGPFEPIPAAGKKFRNDEESIQIHFRESKIVRYVFLSIGMYSGPHGVYTQLGGFPLM